MKLEVIETFNLKDFDKLKSVERKGEDRAGTLFVGDIIECDEAMFKYLNGDNPLHKSFVKEIKELEHVEKVEEHDKLEDNDFFNNVNDKIEKKNKKSKR